MHVAMIRLAKGMAVLGALVLSFLIVMTCISVLGRELNAVFNSDLMQSLAPGLSQACSGCAPCLVQVVLSGG